jgi:hypothetical protein
MAATSIGSTGNHPYPLAKMPELTDPADIQVALRNYHYGQNEVLAPGADATAGIAYYLKEIQEDIADLVTADATVVSKTIIDAKGDLIAGSAADTVVRLAVGSPGYLLSTNTGTASGLEWIAPPQSATTSVVGIVQLSDSTSETSSVKAATPTAVKTTYDAVSTLKQTVDSSTKTANYTLDPADAGKIIIMNVSSSTSIITIPLETTFPAGARVDILQIGSVQTSVAPVSGSVTLNSKNNNRKLSGQYSAATLIKTGTNSWVLLGDLTA